MIDAAFIFPPVLMICFSLCLFFIPVWFFMSFPACIFSDRLNFGLMVSEIKSIKGSNTKKKNFFILIILSPNLYAIFLLNSSEKLCLKCSNRFVVLIFSKIWVRQNELMLKICNLYFKYDLNGLMLKQFFSLKI